jgi:hypothetical protein
VVWFCNTLNFHGEGDYGFFDDAYYRDDLFDPMLGALDSLIPASIQSIDMVAFFANHPSKVRSIQFWDFNYYRGANPGPEEWQTPELRPLESMETAQKNFRRLVRYLGDRDDIELTTYRELAGRFSQQKDEINPGDLGKITGRILDEKRLVIDDHYSPAEIFGAVAYALTQYDRQGQIPEQIRILRPLGPLEMPVRDPEVGQVPSISVFQLASEGIQYIEETGHLPASLKFEGQHIGTGSLLALFSELYAKIAIGETLDQIDVIPMEPYPSVNEHQIIREVEACQTWPVHREDLDMGHLVELTRLQLWTLKPAMASGF